MYIGTKCGNDF